MNPELLHEATSRLAAAAEALEQTITNLNAGLEMKTDAVANKVDRIIAAVEDNPAKALEARIAELERVNAELRADLKANAARSEARTSLRKTLPPTVTALLAKSGLDNNDRIDPAVLDQTLAALSIEQRIAVKAQMARAGIID